MVSVLLPNYNNAPYLKECLDSLFNQTYQDFILYFIDDCSTDTSLEIVATYPQEKIVIIKKTSNSGIVDTMNAGLDAIDSKYIIRMDGDDISHPERFERLVNFMEKNPDIAVCSTDIETFGFSSELRIYERNPELNKANLIFGHSIGHASSIFRTLVLKTNNIKYENLFWRLEDYLLFYRIMKFGKTTSIDGAYYLYRRTAENENPEINVRKLTEYEKFYSMILADVGLSPNIQRLELHLVLKGLKPVSHTLSVYKKYSREIITSNKKSKLFPAKELSFVLKGALRRLVFKLFDKNKLSKAELIYFLISDFKFFRYYLGTRRKKIKS